MKIWFTFSSQGSKWDQLKEEVVTRRYNMSVSDVKEIFESGIEEHNPFFRW